MLKRKLKKNIDLVLFLLFFGVIYAGGWQAEVFGLIQRGVLATGLMEAERNHEFTAKTTELNFQLYDSQGNTLHGQRLEGKTVFVNFWASWCPPCLAEMPGIQSLYEQVANKEDIVFLMISVDDEKDKARNLLTRKSYDFPLYFPASVFPAGLQHQSIPATYVISPEGKIVYQREGMASYDSQSFKEFLLQL